jgi:signal transduction histidine kinase
VTLWRRWRADLARPEVPTGRDALGFLVGTAVVIVIAAQLTDPGTALDLIALAPAVLAFALRGLIPRLPAEVFAVMVLVPVAVAIGHDGALEGAFFLSVMMVFNTSSHLGSLTRALIIMGVAVAVPWLVAEHLAPESEIAWEPWVLAHVFIFTLGRAVYRQGRLIEELERARRALADQEVAEERRRIARELHDLAGHTLAAMLLHVTGARHVLRRDLAEAERALIDAETVGRASLDQIRATVASLRADERGTDPALAGVADLVALVDEYRRAGLVVDVTIAESAADLTGPVGVAVHRVAREGLCNVARHAPGNRVELRVDCVRDGVRLLVVDQGRPASPPDPQALHFGLVGMAERTRSLGGRFDAGPTADGWRLEARFPTAVADQFVAS